MATATINVGSLTTTFTPTATSCLSWYIAWSNNHTWLQHGTVGPAVSDCFPSGYNAIDGYYSPGVCPQGYEYACSAGIEESATVATCCPSGFVCQTRPTDDLNVCYTRFSSNTFLTVDVWTTMPGEKSEFVSTTAFRKDQWGMARGLGVIVRRSGDDPTWPGVTGASSVPTSRPSVADGNGNGPSDGLSSGAKIGIGVGVSLGLFLIGGSFAAAFRLARRRKRDLRKAEVDRKAGSNGLGRPLPAEIGGQTWYAELAGANDGTIGRHPRELPAYPKPTELDVVAGR
ncbi:Serine peptidase- family S28 [Apiospora rasikravindrae]|uniref:Serine peptidase- family S28 n=1 Tax=Apiospora rasikravindrae TaxID=990691 RepID=A0ABR1SWJ3_9PEZI